MKRLRNQMAKSQGVKGGRSWITRVKDGITEMRHGRLRDMAKIRVVKTIDGMRVPMGWTSWRDKDKVRRGRRRNAGQQVGIVTRKAVG
jgi:hypothetical protein